MNCHPIHSQLAPSKLKRKPKVMTRGWWPPHAMTNKAKSVFWGILFWSPMSNGFLGWFWTAISITVLQKWKSSWTSWLGLKKPGTHCDIDALFWDLKCFQFLLDMPVIMIVVGVKKMLQDFLVIFDFCWGFFISFSSPIVLSIIEDFENVFVFGWW